MLVTLYGKVRIFIKSERANTFHVFRFFLHFRFSFFMTSKWVLWFYHLKLTFLIILLFCE